MKSTEPITLIVCERIHRVKDERPNPRVGGQTTSQMLTVKVQQNWIEKAFGLAASGTCGHDNISPGRYSPDSFFLMRVQGPISVDRREKISVDGLCNCL
jgi:hypothetical protein